MTNKMKLALVAVFIVTMSIGYVCARTPTKPPAIGHVSTHDTVVIFRDLPVPGKPTFKDRIVYREMPPELVITTETRVDTVAVAEYRDTTAVVLPRIRMAYDGRYLRFSAVLNDGRLFRQDTRATTPFQAFTTDTTLHVRTERAPFRGLRRIRDCALAAAGGAVVGAIVADDSWRRTAIATGAVGCVATIAF